MCRIRVVLLAASLAVLSLVPVAMGQVPRVLSGIGGNTVVALFHVGDEATHGWVLAQGEVRASYVVQVSRTDLRRQVAELRTLIGTVTGESGELTQYAGVLESARDLYDLLIGPVERQIGDATNVMIVPSDVLWYLPFAALVRCQGCEGTELLGGRFWIEDQSISLASSLEMALSMMGLTTGTGLESALVVSADCDAMYPGAQEEARAVAGVFADSWVLQGSEATRSRTEDLLAARRYDVLHFTVGSLHPVSGDPLLSGVSLCGGEADEGTLSVAEILSLRVRTGLLVLSGSMLRLPEEMDGAMAIALDALRSSGIASVVLSLAVVNDAVAPRFMEAFYEGLRTGLSRAEALRQAQLTLLRSDLYRHPFYWAPFVVYGDWRGMAMPQMPGMEKLDYSLAQMLLDWRSRAHLPDESPPVVSVLVTLQRPATSDDLEAFGGLSGDVELEGSFGAFVQVRIPLPLLEALAALPQVRSISVPPETIRN